MNRQSFEMDAVSIQVATVTLIQGTDEKIVWAGYAVTVKAFCRNSSSPRPSVCTHDNAPLNSLTDSAPNLFELLHFPNFLRQQLNKTLLANHEERRH